MVGGLEMGGAELRYLEHICTIGQLVDRNAAWQLVTAHVILIPYFGKLELNINE